MKSLGFTLIELLVVVGILGILAAGVLVAVDPLEQIRKGQDTNLRNAGVEVDNALNRYYAMRTEFPWCSGGACILTVTQLGNAAFWGATGYLTDLIDDGELKAEFRTGLGQTNANRLYVTSADGESVTVCFQPASKSLRNDDNLVRYNADGVDNLAGKACDTAGTSNGCYWCAR